MSNRTLARIVFHDAHVGALKYDYRERSASLSITAFLEAHERAVDVRIRFREIHLFMCSDTRPWGPSHYIHEATQSERLPSLPSCDCASWRWRPPVLESVLFRVRA